MVWKACERFNILPPNIKRSWNDNDIWSRSLLMGFSGIRDQELFNDKIEWYKATNDKA